MTWESLNWDQILVYVGLLAVLVGFLGFLGWVVRSPDNEIEWWHYIATRGIDGKNHGDLDKLGKLTALVVSSVAVIWQAYALKLDAALLAAYLTYAGAIGGWSAWLRYKQTKDTPNGSSPAA